MTEKPLHVRVALALGWRLAVHPCLKYGDWWWEPGQEDAATSDDALPRYDTDWSATGPLIERFKVCLDAPARLCDAPDKHDCLKWKAGENSANDDALELTGDTPLLATCNLILALSEAGKLQPQEPEIARNP